MGGQIRIACAAWLATLATASALVPLAAGTGWLVQAGLLLAAQTVTGILVRLRSAVLAAPAQVVMSLVALTAVTVPEDAVAGLVPGPRTFGQFGRLLGAGVDDIGHHVVPAPVTDGIALLLFGGVLLVGLLVDLTAVTLGSAASAGLPLLALYSVAAGVAQSGASWPYFLCAATGYLLLLLTEGRERVVRWGRFFPGAGEDGARAGLPQHSLASPRARTGRRIGAVTLSAATVVPLLLPSLDDGLLNLDGGSGPSGVDRIAVDNSAVSLQNQLNQPEDRPVLHYTTTSDRPEDLHLRVAALDTFDGEKWRSSSRELATQQPPVPWPAAGLPDARRDDPTDTTVITASDTYTQTSLPVPYPATSIVTPPTGTWQYDSTTQTMTTEDPGRSTQNQSWTVEHRLVDPSGDELDDAPPPPPEIRDLYTEVPGTLPSVVRETAATVTADATNDHERAVLLQQYFRGGDFQYNKKVAYGNGDAIATFLEQKKGFCVHFAFTMAAMARTLDIPAQVVVGFAPGTPQDGETYEVSVHDAHAWPELYFEGAGWVRFEPTPAADSIPAYTEQSSTNPDTDATPKRPEEEQPGNEQPAAPTPDPPSTCDDALASGGSCPELSLDGDSEGGTLLSWPLLAAGTGGLFVAAAAASPGLWRRRARSRRLAAGGGPLSAWQELTDTAWDYGIVPVRSETPRQAAGRIVRVGQLPAATAATVHRVAAAVEEELYAPPAARRDGTAGTDLSREVREVARALGVSAGRSARVRAALLPRSAMRVREAATQRAAAAARRVRAALARAAARLHRA